jgi:hypothetical protein
MSENTLREKLQKDLDVCNWSMLHSHFVRDILFVVDSSLDFIEACVAAAENDSKKIAKYIENKQLKRPDGYDVEKWRKEKPLFKCLVISPHVFVQLTDIKLKKK